MKRKSNLFPLLPFAAGILALGLRIWLHATGVDNRGLFSTAHPANALSYILAAATLLLVYFGVAGNQKTPAYKKLFPPSIPALIGSVVGAVGIVSAVITQLLTVRDLFAFLTCLVGVLAVGSLLLAGIFRQKQLRPRYYMHGIVTVYFILYLLSQYRIWNIEPQLQNYFPQLLACVFLMLCTYQRTVLDAKGGKLMLYRFFHGGAIFTCCAAAYSSTPIFYGCMAIWMLTADFYPDVQEDKAQMVLPGDVHYCIHRLTAGGYSAYCVGGCVRDFLLGLTPHDYDLCTNATPEQICEIFADCQLVRNGEKHGTIGVVLKGVMYEITTFRTDGDYSDSRHPDWVKFVSSIREDLARRDFTVNAMAYCPNTGYVDPFGGQADLENGILRAVGDPEARFREDALRILRGVRFALRFHLTPDAATKQAMLQCAPLMDSLARERVLTELCGILPLLTAQDLLDYAPIFTQIIPELAPAIDFQQHSIHHIYDVYTHTAHAVEAVPGDTALRFAALLHDIGKPQAFTQDENGNGHFYGHAKISAQLAEDILHRLKAPNALREQVVFLIEHHMTPLEPNKQLLRRRMGKYGDENMQKLFALQKADMLATGTKTQEAMQAFSEIETLLAEIRAEGDCLTVRDLAVNGSDLLELGIAPGPSIGKCMDYLLTLVQDEVVANTKEELLPAAKEFFQI